MRGGRSVSRRSVLIGGGLGAAALFLGGAPAGAGVLAPRRAAGAAAAVGDPLWQQAYAKGIVYGSSTATWQVGPDPGYSQLFQREAGILFTEDDLLWYRLRPTPTSGLDFSYGDQIIAYAEGNGSTCSAPTSSGMRASATAGRTTTSGG